MLSKSVGQLHFKKKLREKLDAEIAAMEANGIIKLCADSKGFNPAAFLVLKKSAAIRVVNFMPTRNHCLLDIDLLPSITTDQLKPCFGTGDKYSATVDLKSGYHKIQIMHNGECPQ